MLVESRHYTFFKKIGRSKCWISFHLTVPLLSLYGIRILYAGIDYAWNEALMGDVIWSCISITGVKGRMK